MQLITVNSVNNPHLPFVNQLYHQAFPLAERREWPQLLELLNHSAVMRLQVIAVEDKTVGFVVFWDLCNWRFIEYLAIAPDFRGLKYGERIMKELLKDHKVLLEVEPPLSVDARRRIKFYEQLGLAVLPYAYRQPSYTEAAVYYDMKLMSNAADTPMEELAVLLRHVLHNVYGTNGAGLKRD